MNPVFVFLVIFAGIWIWVCGAVLFKPIGKLIQILINNFKEALTKEEDDE